MNEFEILQQLATYRAVLRSLRAQLATATPTARNVIRSRVTAIITEVAALNTQLSGAEMPAPVMLALADVSDAALGIAQDVGGVAGHVLQAAADVAAGAGSTARMLPLLLLGVVIVAGIAFYKGTARVSVRR